MFSTEKLTDDVLIELQTSMLSLYPVQFMISKTGTASVFTRKEMSTKLKLISAECDNLEGEYSPGWH